MSRWRYSCRQISASANSRTSFALRQGVKEVAHLTFTRFVFSVLFLHHSTSARLVISMARKLLLSEKRGSCMCSLRIGILTAMARGLAFAFLAFDSGGVLQSLLRREGNCVRFQRSRVCGLCVRQHIPSWPAASKAIAERKL